MPDEIVGGDTTEGAVPVSGDAAGSTDNAPEISTDAGTAPASAPYEIPEAYRDQFVPAERYQNLESKLGNWQQTEAAAQQYAQLSQDPRVIAALQPQQTPTQPEQLPDFSQMQPQQVVEYMDQRAEKRAQQVAEQAIEKFKAENVDPMAKDLYTRQANEMVQGMEAKYPDFKENRQAIAEFLDQNPALAENLNEKSLETAYRYVTWENQQKAGAKQAVAKLQTKAKDTAVKPQGSAPAGKPRAKTIADAWNMAEESTNT